jgi:hypothetical protein
MFLLIWHFSQFKNRHFNLFSLTHKTFFSWCTQPCAGQGNPFIFLLLTAFQFRRNFLILLCTFLRVKRFRRKVYFNNSEKFWDFELRTVEYIYVHRILLRYLLFLSRYSRTFSEANRLWCIEDFSDFKKILVQRNLGH